MAAQNGRPCPYCQGLVPAGEKACPTCRRYVPGGGVEGSSSNAEVRSFRIKALLSGLAIIAIGVAALIWPDAMEDVGTFGRHGFIKMLLKKCWGTGLGVVLIIFGGLGILGGFLASREDIPE